MIHTITVPFTVELHVFILRHGGSGVVFVVGCLLCGARWARWGGEDTWNGCGSVFPEPPVSRLKSLEAAMPMPPLWKSNGTKEIK